MDTFKFRPFCWLVLITVAFATAYAQPPADSEVVVRVGESETITKTELERALAAILQARMTQARRMGVSDPSQLASSPIGQEEKLKLIDTMVDGKVLYILAKQAGVEVTDEEVQAEITRNSSTLPEGTTMEEFLAKQGMTMKEVEDLTRMRLVSRKFSQQQAENVTVPEEEVLEEYEKLKERNIFDSADIAQILIRVTGNDPGAWEQGKQKIDAAYERVQKGEDFAAVAKDVSEDERTRESGGVIQGAMRGNLGPEFDQRMFDEPLNEVSEPFKTRVGWHILKVTARSTAPLEGELKERFSGALLQRKKQQKIEELVNEARSTMSIQISLPPEAPAGEEGAPIEAPTLLDGAT